MKTELAAEGINVIQANHVFFVDPVSYFCLVQLILCLILIFSSLKIQGLGQKPKRTGHLSSLQNRTKKGSFFLLFFSPFLFLTVI